MTPIRPSTEQKITRGLSTILTVIVGVVLVAVGIWVIAVEAKTPPLHTTHLAFGIGLVVLGAGSIRPDPIIVFVQKIFVTLGDTNLPLVGGRRKDDPKPPSAP